jgi:hypothetical protein
MGVFLTIAGIGLSTLFGITSLLDRVERTEKQTEITLINLAGVGLLGVGAYILYKEMK